MKKINIEEEINSIARQIIEKYHPEKIILFGSSARGETGPDSDIDFLVVKKDTPDLGRERSRELRRLIEKHWAVDFLVYKPEELQEREELGDPFIRAVLKQGKIIYGS